MGGSLGGNWVWGVVGLLVGGVGSEGLVLLGWGGHGNWLGSGCATVEVMVMVVGGSWWLVSWFGW